MAIGGAILFRLLFVASRSDWHGGFSLGPRYLMVLLPFLLIPVGYLTAWLLEQGERGWLILFGVFSSLCISQQLYFSLGEIFNYLHRVKWKMAAQGVDVFAGDRPYLDWSLTPLFRLHQEGVRGPYLLQQIPLDNMTLWAMGTVAAVLLMALTLAWISRQREL